MAEVDATIRRAQGLDDYRTCVEIQKQVWGFADSEDLAALPLLLIGNRYGGSVLIAEDGGRRPIGFVFALLGQKPSGGQIWWSHMAAVVPGMQGSGIGLALKLAQRRDALANGIGEIWWTFDPMLAMNAHFNLRKLGVVSREYEDDIYGTSSSPLHHGLPTDRLRVEWTLNSPRVMDRVGGSPPVILRDFDGLVRVFETQAGRPGSPNLDLDESPLLMEIPTDFPSILETDRALAGQWQRTVRTACRHYLGRGYVVTDFMIVEEPRRQGLYVLERAEGTDA